MSKTPSPAPGPSSDLAAAMASRRPETGEDQLKVIRSKASELRGLQMRAQDLTDSLAEVNKGINRLKADELPVLMTAAGLVTLTLEASGNLPELEFSLRPYYKANISAEWPQERQNAAFDWLEENGHGDLIKTVVIIELGRGEIKLLKALSKALLKIKGITPDQVMVRKAVPWNSLTGWLKEQIEKYKRRPPLDVLGATVGQVVDVKQTKKGK